MQDSEGNLNKSAETEKRTANFFACSLLICRLPLIISEIIPLEPIPALTKSA
jgi:hypothetical protein